jgi:hypothetical protein
MSGKRVKVEQGHDGFGDGAGKDEAGEFENEEEEGEEDDDDEGDDDLGDDRGRVVGGGGAGGDDAVTVRAMSNPEVFFYLHAALTDRGSGGSGIMGGKWKELERLRDAISQINPALAVAEKYAVANSLKTDLEKVRARTMHARRVGRFFVDGRGVGVRCGQALC